MERNTKGLDLISIVVPVYNVEEYLNKTIQSIINQTYKKLEIILVDDGSTDSSGRICDSFAENDSRIIVIHKANGGLVSARKSGVDLAKGKYLLMIDGDDWVEHSIVEYLYDLITMNNVKFVTSGMIRDFKGRGALYIDELSEGLYKEDEWVNIKDKIIFFDSELRYGIRPSVCGKMYLTDILKEVYTMMDDDIENGEDWAIVYPIAFNSKSFYISHECLYHYVMREKSITNSVNRNYLLSMQKWYDFVIKITRDIDDEIIKKQLDAALVKLLLRGINYHMGLNKDVSVPSYLLPNEMCKGKVALYGAGKVGQAYYAQLINDDRYDLVAWVDEKWNESADVRKHVDYLSKSEFDYVLIAITDKDVADEIKNNLGIKLGIPKNKIYWEKPIAIMDKFIKW